MLKIAQKTEEALDLVLDFEGITEEGQDYLSITIKNKEGVDKKKISFGKSILMDFDLCIDDRNVVYINDDEGFPIFSVYTEETADFYGYEEVIKVVQELVNIAPSEVYG